MSIEILFFRMRGAFCGHATIAIMYDLISTPPELLNEKELKIKEQSGALPVFNRQREEDAVYVTAPEPKFLKRNISRNEIAEALGMDIKGNEAVQASRYSRRRTQDADSPHGFAQRLP